ncbi:MAG TPA: hypothetical protein VGF45_00900 [Polyangia bacterium]
MNRTYRNRTWLALMGATLVWGCGGGDDPPVGDGGGQRDAIVDQGGADLPGDLSADRPPSDGGAQPDTASDTGAPDGGAVPDGGNTTPITERPSRAIYTCAIERPRVDHTPRYWQSGPGLLTTTGGTAQFVRHEAMTENPIFPTMGKLLVGSLGKDGSFGAATTVPGVGNDVGPMGVAPRGDGLAAIWVEGMKLRFAAFDAANAVVVPPTDLVTDGIDRQTVPKIAAGPDGGFGVLYGTATGFNNRQVMFMVLGADGSPKGAARRIDQAQANGFVPVPAVSLVGGASGYAMIWRALAEPRGGIDFAKAGVDGAETLARRRISVTNQADYDVGGSVGFDLPTSALIEVAGGYVAAWTEMRQSMSFDSGAWSTVNLVRLNAEGLRQGTPVPMRAPVDSVDETEASLVRFGDAVGVLWARGTHIYICAGCVPDHRIDLLLVDPVDLVPVSNPVSLVNNMTGMRPGGLLRRQVAVVGTSVLTTFDTTFHVHHTSASASFSCVK